MNSKTSETGNSGAIFCYPPVLDACCGGRKMWFNKTHPLAIYQDKRRETVEWQQNDKIPGTDRTRHRERMLEINPDVLGDFTQMEFPDNTFWLVVMDPPHLETLGENASYAKQYGRLLPNWETDIAAAFSECFRVLKPCGTLVFKWNSYEIDMNRVLALSPVEPLFGHTTGRQSKTHWVTFMKPPVGG